MALLHGWQRRLALLPLFLSLLGWLVYSTGFIWILVEWNQELQLNSTFNLVPDSRYDPLMFPYYEVLVGGPFVFLFGLLHAVLPSVASSIVGVVSAFVSTTFLVSVGWVIYCGGLVIMLMVNSQLTVSLLDVKTSLIFGGAVCIALCWCFVMMLSVSYNYEKTPNTYGLANYNEIFNPESRVSSRVRNIPFTPGVARILSVPFVILSAIGWCLFVVGVNNLPELESLNPDYMENTSQSFFYLSFYGSVVVGPLLYLAALFHAGCLRGATTIMGVFTCIVHMVYVIFMGYNVTEFGHFIYSSCQDSPPSLVNCSSFPSTINVNIIYVFAGGSGSLLFWTFVLALWPFYRSHPSQVQEGGEERNVATIDAANPSTYYSTMQLRESVSYGSRSAQHNRPSLIVTDSNEHK